MSFKPDNKIIFALAIPAVLQTLVRSSFSLIDAYWVGKMGSIELAALSISYFIVWGTYALGEMISTGTNALVAQTVGAENKPLSQKISTVNIVNNFFFSLMLGLMMIPLLPFFYLLINLNPEQSELAGNYLVTFLIGLPCMTLLSTVSSIFRGYGDTKTPFYLLLIAVGLNIFLTPILIFGVSGHLILGLKGAALSTLISYFLAFLIGYVILRKRDLIHSTQKFRFDKSIIFETLKIGFPISMNGVGFSIIYIFVARFVADYGTTGLAALGIGHRSEAISYHICVGFSLAATILVGQYMGAGKPKSAERFAWKILGLCSIIMLIYGILLFIFSKEVAEIFTNDLNVINAASTYNKIAAVVLIFSAAEVTLSGAFSGAGDTVPPAIIGLPFNLLRIPLCAILSPLFGLTGIWFAICATVVLKGVIITIWFKRGKWKLKKIKLIKKKPNILELTEVE
jgi:putative MATE family efflux protein